MPDTPPIMAVRAATAATAGANAATAISLRTHPRWARSRMRSRCKSCIRRFRHCRRCDSRGSPSPSPPPVLAVRPCSPEQLACLPATNRRRKARRVVRTRLRRRCASPNHSGSLLQGTIHRAFEDIHEDPYPRSARRAAALHAVRSGLRPLLRLHRRHGARRNLRLAGRRLRTVQPLRSAARPRPSPVRRFRTVPRQLDHPVVRRLRHHRPADGAGQPAVHPSLVRTPRTRWHRQGHRLRPRRHHCARAVHPAALRRRGPDLCLARARRRQVRHRRQ